MQTSRLHAYRESQQDAPWEVLRFSPEWSTFVELVEAWTEIPITDETGLPVARLDQLEEQAGFTFPQEYREWARLVGNHPIMDDDSNQDFVVPVQSARVSDWGGRSMLVVYAENQGCWSMGFVWQEGKAEFVLNGDIFLDESALPVSPLEGAGEYFPLGLPFSVLVTHMFARQLVTGERVASMRPQAQQWVPYELVGELDQNQEEAEYTKLLAHLQVCPEQEKLPTMLPVGFWPVYNADYIIGPVTFFGIAGRSEQAWSKLETWVHR